MVGSPVDNGAPMDQAQMYHHNTRAGGGSPHVAHGQNFARGPPPLQHEGTRRAQGERIAIAHPK